MMRHHLHAGTDWPKQPITVRQPVLYFRFHTDGSTVDWGYEIEITPMVPDRVVLLPWLLDLAKTVAQQAAEGASLLVEGTPLSEIEQNPHSRRFLHSELMREGLDELFVSLSVLQDCFCCSGGHLFPRAGIAKPSSGGIFIAAWALVQAWHAPSRRLV